MSYSAVEPARSYVPTFQITWESTLKCNLDCTYCGKGINGGHDNSIPHPSLEDCLKTVDFLLEYVDAYMKYKIPAHRLVGLNVFGGESLFHPNIVEILDYIKLQHKKYKDNWQLSIQTVTNAVVKEKIWNRIVDKIDYWTISYHSESTEEQQDLVRKNLLDLKEKNKHYNCSILMHPKKWENCINMIEWCKKNNIPYLPRQLDHGPLASEFFYKEEQVKWFDNLRGVKTDLSFDKKLTSNVNMESKGRSCCGGNPMHINGDQSCSQSYIPNNRFEGWHCSVHYFFMFVKQVTKEVFVNKDCKMNFDGNVGPIGYLTDTKKIIDRINNNVPNAIICKKSKCWCGLCAPKAESEEKYNSIMDYYLIPTIDQHTAQTINTSE